MSSKTKILPLFASGTVVKGFGRGSKELGIPTANFSEDTVDKLPKEIDTGIYYGLATMNQSPVYKMVMSIGWNPFYKNEKKSMEVHILKKFDEDFYGALLKVIIVGYIRPEENFTSLDDLITAIKNDISISEKQLSTVNELFKHPYLTDPKVIGDSHMVYTLDQSGSENKL